MTDKEFNLRTGRLKFGGFLYFARKRNLVSLFNGTSPLVSYLKPKSSL